MALILRCLRCVSLPKTQNKCGGHCMVTPWREPSWERGSQQYHRPAMVGQWIAAVPVDNCVRFVSTWRWGQYWWPSLWLTLWLSFWGSCIGREADSSFRAATSQIRFRLSPWRVCGNCLWLRGRKEIIFFRRIVSPLWFRCTTSEKSCLRRGCFTLNVGSSRYIKSTCCLAFGWCLLWLVHIHCLEGEWRWRLW